jgi:DNA polymerase-1
MHSVVAIDTETFLIGPGSIAPKLVCLSAAVYDVDEDTIRAVLYGNAQLDEIEEFMEGLLEDDEIQLVFHNIGFDLTVIANAFPRLIPLIFTKLAMGGMTDTGIREKLLNLSTHGKLEYLYAPDGSRSKIQYRLMDLVLNYTGVDRADEKSGGEDIWRLNYEMLDGKHADDYPREASKYAMLDAIDTLEVHDLQAERICGEIGPASVKTAEFHAATAFALRLMTCWGMLIDQEKVNEIEAMLTRELTPEKLSLLIEAGILKPAQPALPYANGARGIDGLPKMKKPTNPTIKTKVLRAHIFELCKKLGIKVKVTDKALKRLKSRYVPADNANLTVDDCSTDKEVYEGLASLDKEAVLADGTYTSILRQYQHRQVLQKLVTTYLPHLRGTATIHPEFDVLKATGRTSSYASSKFPSNNVQQEDPRTRPCFIARPGYVFCSVDYSAIELVSLAQKCFTLFGHSVLRDKINAGVDPHAYLGSGIAVRKDESFSASIEQNSPDDIYEAFIALEKTDPEFYEKWRTLAKPVGLGFPGGMGIDTFVVMARNSYGVIITPEEAKELKDIWLETYPEMVDYFRWIREESVDPNNFATDDDGKPVKLYSYISPFGMYRAGATYCAAANGAALQTPTAEGAKSSVFNIARACYDPTMRSVLYDSRPVAFIHDENIAELREDEKLQARADEMSKIMVDSMEVVFPDMNVKAGPTLMRRWNKKAKAVYDEQGNLQIWEPKELLA